jgi:hypothetical protein
MRLHSVLLLLLLSAPALCVAAQSPATNPSPAAGAQIVFTFEHPQLQPARYTFTIDESGQGRFTSTPGNAATGDDDLVPIPMDRAVRLDPAFAAGLFQYARAHNFFDTRCSNERTHLAFTGNKTIAYSGPDGKGSCSFVWAADPALQSLSDRLGGVAFTLEIGQRLDLEVQHDRLGLDAELQGLQDAVKDHRADGLANIAPQLQTIADDQQVMNRARKRAIALLSSCEAPQKRD